MFQHLIYKCPKCKNTLLVSNKMLHDLRCTEENPATYENILRQSQVREVQEESPYNSSSQFSSGVRRSNNDGTSSEIKKNINIKGEEEYIETRYDPEGNIISRKRAENIIYNNNIPQNNNYQEVSEFYEYEDDNNDYVNENNIENGYYVEPNIEINNKQQIIYHTALPQEIIYEAPAQYDPNITINQPIQETIINADENLNDNIVNDIIRSSIRQAGNSNLNIQINNQNIGNNIGNINNINDITNYNYNQTNIINNINNDPFSNLFNQDFNNNNGINFNNNNGTNFNNNSNNIINLNMSPEDILRRTAGIGSHNYNNNNMDYQY